MANQLENLLRLNRTPAMPRGSNRLAGVVEPAMTAGSNILAEIPAYAAGMAELNKTGLPSEGVRRAEEVSERLTYNPRTMEGQAGLQSLTNGVMKVMDALGVDEAVNYLNNTVVPRIQETFGEDAAREIGSSVMMSLPFVRKVPGINAFHGSPHDFPPVDMIVNKETGKTYYVETDRFGSFKNHPVVQNSPDNYEFIEHFPHGHFDNSKIGTGEGAQAYGRGGYFAGNEDVAKGYRDQLTPRDLDYEEDLGRLYKEAEKNQDYTRMEMLERAMMHDEPKDFREIASDADYDEDYRKVASDFADEIEEMNPNIGKMYEVDIDASPDELLDYDVPLTEQSDYVKSRLPQELLDREGARGIHAVQDFPLPNSHMMSDSDYMQKASEVLQKSGIKGIRYKDGFSRGAEGGSSNYVIFDDRLISIAKKYGIAIPAAAALLSQETGLNPSSFYEEDNPV